MLAMPDTKRIPKFLGRNKYGFTTKIHALVDALGNSLKFILTTGRLC